jgi:hypothetical protein
MMISRRIPLERFMILGSTVNSILHGILVLRGSCLTCFLLTSKLLESSFQFRNKNVSWEFSWNMFFTDFETPRIKIKNVSWEFCYAFGQCVRATVFFPLLRSFGSRGWFRTSRSQLQRTWMDCTWYIVLTSTSTFSFQAPETERSPRTRK